MLNERRSEETISQNEMGVFEETAPLRRVMMWGAPGTEAVLGQLLPKKVSCFEKDFKVPSARVEFAGAVKLLENEGVQTLFVKDLLAEKIHQEGIRPTKSLGQLHEELQERGELFYNKYKGQGISSPEVLKWIGPILDEDKHNYGEDVATVINQMLSLDERQGLQGDERLLPLSNVVYARDQSNLLGKTWIWSKMNYPIRREEVSLYRSVLEYHRVIPDDVQVVQVQGKGGFEGGDGIAHGGIFYIGCGGRSNLRGILQAAPSLLSQPDARLLVSYDGARTRKEKGEMDAMHLDTYWMPFDKQKVVACLDECKEREVVEVKDDGKGGLSVRFIGLLVDHLKDSAIEITDISKEEQLHYAPNFLNLGNKKVILSLEHGNELTGKLTNMGYKVYSANLTEITKGFGGLHCMTAAIKRG